MVRTRSDCRAAWARVAGTIGKREYQLVIQKLKDQVNPVLATFELDGTATTQTKCDSEGCYPVSMRGGDLLASGAHPRFATGFRHTLSMRFRLTACRSGGTRPPGNCGRSRSSR